MIDIVTREEKEQEFLQKGKLVFICGQNAVVKEIAYLLERRFFSAGILSTVIDYDKLYDGLCNDCKNDSDEFLRRTIESAKLFLHSAIITICYGNEDSIITVDKLVNNSDLIVVSTTSIQGLNDRIIAFDLYQIPLEDAVHSLYKKLVSAISQ